jgi:hypothetical protein
VSETKLIEFTINLTSIVFPKFFDGHFDVWMSGYSFNISYNDSFGFKLVNRDLADKIIRESLDRLFENKLFGSGWNYYLGQKRPRLYVTNEAVLIYD